MPKVITKRSVTQGVVPVAANLAVGELGVNTADGRLYTKHSDDSIKEIGGAAGIINESGATRTLALTDDRNYLRHTGSSGATITVPPQASVAWLDGAEIHVRRAALGTLTIVAGAGVTLYAPSGGTLDMTDRMTVTLKRIGINEWDVLGQTVPL